MHPQLLHGGLMQALRLLVAIGAAGAARLPVRRPVLRGAGADASALGEATLSGLDEVVDAMLGLNGSRQRRFRHTARRGGGLEPELDEAIHEGIAKMDWDEALQGVRAAQPPPEVLANLSRLIAARGAGEEGFAAKFGAADGAGSKEEKEDAKKAIAVLNDLIVSAQERLGNKSLECHENKEDTHNDMERIKREMTQMSMERANLNRIMTSSLGAIATATSNAQVAKERLRTQEIHYKEQRTRDQRELELRTRDLNASAFILDLTACGSLLQGSGFGTVAAGGKKSNASHGNFAVRICENASGVPDVQFKDARLANASSQLSSDSKRMLYLALARAQKVQAGLGLDEGGPELGLLAIAEVPGAAPIDAEKQARKCIQADGGCGPLHDTFGTLWTAMDEMVDEKTLQMNQDVEAFKHFNEALNNELTSIAIGIKEQQSALQSATTAGGTLATHQAELLEEQKNLEKISWNNQNECKMTIREILYKQICAIHKVRDELINVHVKDASVADVSDCYVSDFLAGTCSKDCDNYLIGGVQTMSRDIITKNNEYGAPCPGLHVSRPCNRKKCPVDCMVSEWSAWSKCTSACGGGVQSRMRLLEQKPKNDGQACNTLQETQVCNSGACDRDCALGEWSKWSACDMACNSGFRQRTREVVIPEFGKGTCPGENDDARMERKPCNTEPCVGDEICTGMLDVVLLIDGSGSLGEEGFLAMKTFARKIVERFKPKAHGHDAVQAGAVLFGNGHLDKDKVMSDAILVSALTTDMEKLKESIDGLEFQKGMTNMAQAVHKAKSVIKGGARMNAQTIVILLTDGRMASKSQVAHAVEDVRKSARMMVVHVQSHPLEDYVKLLKNFASRPWMTNYMLVRGKQLLSADYVGFVSSVVARTCKNMESPSAISAAASTVGFALDLEGFTCGGGVANSMQKSPADCYTFAVKHEGSKAFAFGGKPGPAPGTVLQPGRALTAADTPYFTYRCDVYTEECTADTAQGNQTWNTYKFMDVGV